MVQGAGVPPSILLRAGASLALLAAFTLFSEGLEFSGRFSTIITVSATASVSTATAAFAAFGLGNVDLDLATFKFGVVDGSDNGLALVLLGNEHEAEALGLATGAGGEDDFVDRGVCGHEFFEVVLRCGERQVADVEFEAFGVLAFFLPPFFLSSSASRTPMRRPLMR